MRTLAIVLAVVGGLVLFGQAAHAGGWKLDDYLKENNTSDWAGYGVGTMTHMRKKQVMSMPQMPPQEEASEEKKTLVKITETEYVIKVERLMKGNWVTTEEREKKDKGLKAKVEDAGKGTLTIGGVAYECVKKKITWMKGEEVDETVVAWEHAEKGLLKMEFAGDVSAAVTTTNLAATWTIGGVTVAGREMQMEMSGGQMPGMKGAVKMSMDVPGRTVGMTLAGSQGPMKFSMTEELIAFVKK